MADQLALGDVADVNPESLGAGTPSSFEFRYIDLGSVSHGSINWGATTIHHFGSAPSRARRLLRDGDVLFGTVRPVLRSHAALRSAPSVCVASTGFAVVRARDGLSDPRFLAHYLLSDACAREARRVEVGSNYPAVNEGDVRRFGVPPFAVEEQRRIAEILDALDDAIAGAESIVAKLVRLREGLILAAMDKVATGEWQPLGAFVRQSRPIVYGILMPGEDVDEGVPVVKVKDIIDGEIQSSGLLRTSRAIHNAYIRSALETGDILFSIRGSVGRTAVVPPSRRGANITQDTARIATDGTPPEFLLAAFEHPQFRRFIATHTIGQAVRGINLRELREAPIPVVSTEGPSLVASTYISAGKQLSCARERAAKLCAIRSGLAADLLSGRVRTVSV